MWCVTLMDELLVNIGPGTDKCGSLAVGNSRCMNGISIMMVKDKNVIVAATRLRVKATSLI